MLDYRDWAAHSPATKWKVRECEARCRIKREWKAEPKEINAVVKGWTSLYGSKMKSCKHLQSANLTADHRRLSERPADGAQIEASVTAASSSTLTSLLMVQTDVKQRQRTSRSTLNLKTSCFLCFIFKFLVWRTVKKTFKVSINSLNLNKLPPHFCFESVFQVQIILSFSFLSKHFCFFIAVNYFFFLHPLFNLVFGLFEL